MSVWRAREAKRIEARERDEGEIQFLKSKAAKRQRKKKTATRSRSRVRSVMRERQRRKAKPQVRLATIVPATKKLHPDETGRGRCRLQQLMAVMQEQAILQGRQSTFSEIQQRLQHQHATYFQMAAQTKSPNVIWKAGL